MREIHNRAGERWIISALSTSYYVFYPHSYLQLFRNFAGRNEKNQNHRDAAPYGGGVS